MYPCVTRMQCQREGRPVRHVRCADLRDHFGRFLKVHDHFLMTTRTLSRAAGAPVLWARDGGVFERNILIPNFVRVLYCSQKITRIALLIYW